MTQSWSYWSQILINCQLFFREGVKNYFWFIKNLLLFSFGQRQFKLSDDLKNLFKGDRGSLIQNDKGKWLGINGRFQGVDIWKLGDLGYEKGKSFYKLALRDNWTQAKESDGYKNVFGLVKVSWEEVGGRGKWSGVGNEKITEVTVNDTNKVWLIIAKGKSAMYLMPVVRTPNWCGTWSEGVDEEDMRIRREAKAKIEKNGVLDIAEWTKTVDTWKGWEKKWDSELQESMKTGNGFSITRKVEITSRDRFVIEKKKRWEGRFNGWGEWEKIKKNMKVYGYEKEWSLYKNAGMLGFKGTAVNKQKCSDMEHYFPLDFVVIGNSSKVKFSSPHNSKREQTITINDTISEVIGVRLLINSLFLEKKEIIFLS